MRWNIFLIIGIFFIATASSRSDNNEIFLPEELNKSHTDLISAERSTKASLWKNFQSIHGKWSILLDKATGTPHRAIGKAIKLNISQNITIENIEDISMRFLDENAEVMNIKPEDLKLVKAIKRNNIWYVSYKQYFNNIEVLLSEVELRIHENGNLMMFGVSFYNDIDISLVPALSFSSACTNAMEGISKSNKATVQGSGEVKILPVRNNGKVNCRLVYPMIVKSGIDRYRTFVDAGNGNVLSRKNMIHNVESELQINGKIKRASALDEIDTYNFTGLNVKINNNIYTTGQEGKFNFDIDSDAEYEIKFEGPYANVKMKAGNSSVITGTVIPGENNINLNDTNSHLFERMLFFHTNIVHDYIKNVDPEMSCMDIPMTVLIDYNSSMGGANAFSNADTIQFIGCSDDEYRFVESPFVLYHEYGHSINTLLYNYLGHDDMFNMLTQEALADLLAALIIDEPKLGLGAFTNEPDRIMRNLENDVIYPDSLIGESHHDGQVLSGAFWDIRKETSLEYVAKLSHFALYGTPDDPNDGVALYEWFIETLVSADDDGDLSNGVPNADIIIRAFNRHNIGTDLYMQSNFTHEALKDTPELVNPYIAEFSIISLKSLGSVPDSVSLYYSTDNFETTHRIFAAKDGENDYKAEIPAQPKGSLVKYYFTAYDPAAKEEILFSAAKSSFIPFDFLVGYHTAYYDDFEEETGWLTGSTSDNAQSGRWERGIPEEVDLSEWGIGFVQPGEDHSENGDKCYVTGAKGGQSMLDGILVGKTTLNSPAFDISVLESPVVRIWNLFNVIELMSLSEATVAIEASNDNGTTWTRIAKLDDPIFEWRKLQFKVEDYLELSENFKIRIIANNPSNSWFPPMCEVLVDDFEILTTNEEIVNSVEDNETSPELIAYPNPFENKINIDLSEFSGNCDITIMDINGTVVYLKNNYSGAGFFWNGINMSGNEVSAGTYFVQLSDGFKSTVARIIKH